VELAGAIKDTCFVAGQPLKEGKKKEGTGAFARYFSDGRLTLLFQAFSRLSPASF